MVVNKKLLLKSIFASVLITALLMTMAYLPIWEIMTETERSTVPVYLLISSIVIFLILIAIFYLDIRKILERNNYLTAWRQNP
jgi:uncharacterized membrane protein